LGINNKKPEEVDQEIDKFLEMMELEDNKYGLGLNNQN
jgi:hypothetical protein